MGKIKIKLMSDLCSGNGESAGNAIDNDICTDSYGFPYIPGKRLLGCLRDAAVKLKEYGRPDLDENDIQEIFGNADGVEGKFCMGNAFLPEIDAMHQYIDSLKSDKSKEFLINQSTEDKIIRGYTNVRGQTKIGEDGSAEAGSLRFIRVLNQYDTFTKDPIEFECEVDTSYLNDKQMGILMDCCKTLRHIGMDRNRGLGNVCVTYYGEESIEKNTEITDLHTEESDQICISYKVIFNSPITIQEYLEDGSQIRSRTMIGVFSNVYLNKYKEVDDFFTKLFLNGTVKWSALTPFINGIESIPAPFMLMKLKNDNGRLINSFTEESEWMGKKPKNLEGFFMSQDENGGCFVAQPEIETTYHNRINGITGKDKEKKGLYMQDFLKQGMVYGGHIILPNDKALIDILRELLSVGNIRIGRSKKVQYGAAYISNVIIDDYKPESITIQNNDVLFAVLKSDLVIRDNTSIRIDNEYVRKMIAKNLDITDDFPERDNDTYYYHDICRYHVLTGYNVMWNMQKPKVQAVKAGSVYCFKGIGKTYPSEIVIGEYQQEGMGVIKLISFDEMKKYSNIISSRIDTKKNEFNENAVKCLEDTLLYEAAMDEIRRYSFDFYKNRNNNPEEKPIKFEKLPSGRLRLMLQESKDINDLWKKVESMKISDVDSEDLLGRKNNSKHLLEKMYGNKNEEIDFYKMIEDEKLKKALKNNEEVMNRVKNNWKEPLFTVLHICHYQKNKENQKGGKRR